MYVFVCLVVEKKERNVRFEQAHKYSSVIKYNRLCINNKYHLVGKNNTWQALRASTGRNSDLSPRTRRNQASGQGVPMEKYVV